MIHLKTALPPFLLAGREVQMNIALTPFDFLPRTLLLIVLFTSFDEQLDSSIGCQLCYTLDLWISGEEMRKKIDALKSIDINRKISKRENVTLRTILCKFFFLRDEIKRIFPRKKGSRGIFVDGSRGISSLSLLLVTASSSYHHPVQQDLYPGGGKLEKYFKFLLFTPNL